MQIYNFSKVENNLYRGGSPLPSDIIDLHDKLGIKNIISLDKESGRIIRAACKKLGINHIEIPIEHVVDSSIINKIIKALSDTNDPTYIHCKWGKDRTGMAVAIYRCLNGWNYDSAMREAGEFNFGVGLSPRVVDRYKKAVKSVYNKLKEDSGDVKDDVVTQQRDSFDRGSAAPAFNPQQSFSPFLDPKVIYAPYASASVSVYRIIKTASGDSEKAKNYERRNKLKKLLLTLLSYIDSDEQMASIETKEDSSVMPPSDIPQMGQYDNYSGVRGVGPVETGGYAQI